VKPSVLAMASLKGGSGKTTIGLNLAVAAKEAGLRTVVIDVDPQQAAAKWGDVRAAKGDEPTVISAMATRLAQALDEASQLGAQLVVVDTAAHAEGILAATIDAADLVLIPCRAAMIDLQHLAATTQLAEIRAKNVAVFLNAVPMDAANQRRAETVVTGMGINLVPACVSNLLCYSHAITAGQGVTEFDPQGRAATEIRTLFGQIKE
jgi:chromosome partitioning protein